ncbi:MAG: bifunctional folylpolyglutamate synthase/dihydrofolate synthase [Clostridiales bacterium]|nr:bifunctional folylpolyglutamate synthase/dihydrofolate synthase [Clostridiales bacterium]
MIDIRAPQFLQTANKFGIKLGLDRMQALMGKLSHPENALKAFHIAGTNGKGSVSATCASILAWEGYKVGLYTSPFLERFSERIRILDGRKGLLSWEEDDTYGEIDPASLQELSDLVEEKVKELLSEGEEHPTEFELVTAVAFLYFQRQNCDYVVLETGLGGRLDSTNVIQKPEATLITALGFDHMDRLGDTLAKIAGEKGGIIKEGCPVFAMDTHQAAVSEEDAEAAKTVLENIASEKHAPLTFIPNDLATPVASDLDGQTFRIGEDEYKMKLHGQYQLSNVGLAISAMKGFVSEEAIREGVKHTTWKGRLEVVSQDPVVILDGAHNPQGMTSFVDFVSDMPALSRQKPCEIIMGVMADKDVQQMLQILVERWAVPLGRITLVTPDQKRAMRAEDLKNSWADALLAGKAFYNSNSCMYNAREKLSAIDDAPSACELAVRRARASKSPLYVVGSLYLLGEVRGTILKELKEGK